MTKAEPRRSGLLIGLTILVGLFGLWVAAGGAWLLYRRNAAALSLYALLVVGTMAWALWETGLDFWALAPRGDLIVILGLGLALPPVVRRLGSPRWPGAAWPLAGSLLLALLVAGTSLLVDHHDLAGTLPGPRGAVTPAVYAGSPQQDWVA
jgi:quinoprotein glucose dehydrogenase